MKETKIKKLLDEKGISQAEVARMINHEYVGVNFYRQTLNLYVNGATKDVHLFTILRIANVLQVTPNDIIDYEEE